MTSLATTDTTQIVLSETEEDAVSSFQAKWGDDLSTNLTTLAKLCDDHDWAEMKVVCETKIKTSTKKLKKKEAVAEAAYFQAGDMTLARAFLARAHLGLHSFEDAQTTVDNIRSSLAAKKEVLQDYRILRLLKEVLLSLHQSSEVTTLYATAYTATKGQVAPLGDELFLAYGRSCDFMSQQKLAMKMYRSFKDPKYAVWAATAIMLQLTDDTDANKQTILLMTAERLLSKVAAELKDQGQASELYLNILERQQKYEEATKVLTLKSSVFAQEKKQRQNQNQKQRNEDINNEEKNVGSNVENDALIVPLKCSTMLPAARLKLLGTYLIKTEKFDQAVAAYKMVLDVHTADDWEAYTALITLCQANKYAETMQYFEDLEVQHPLLRGPCLGRLALASAQREEEEKDGKDDDVVKEMKYYVNKFGSKPCCYGDIRKYLDRLAGAGRDAVVQYLLDCVKEYDPRSSSTSTSSSTSSESSESTTLNLKQRLDSVRRCIHGHQMLRRLGVATVVGSGSGSSSEDSKSSETETSGSASMLEEWLSIYEATHSVHAMVLAEEKRQEEIASEKQSDNESGGSDGKLQREFHCGDDLILLSVHALLEHEDDSHSYSWDSKQINEHEDVTPPPFLRSDYSDVNLGKDWKEHRRLCSLAAALLEYGLSKSPDNFHLKVMKLRVYAYLGGSRVALAMYDQLGPKHIQLETLAWWILDTVENYVRRLLLLLLLLLFFLFFCVA